jgi:hypothetical protein
MAVPWRTEENLVRDALAVFRGIEISTRLVLGIHEQLLEWQLDSASLLNVLDPDRRK